MLQLKDRALALGASEFGKSKAKGKKYYVIYNDTRINFGAKNMSDYTIHKDPARRQRYLARHMKIKNKAGQLVYKLKESPSYWAMNLLWT
jgi:hypothetical protein